MKKNKLKLLLSIIICFSLINIGGVFSYAGGSSGGGSSGGGGWSFASEGARPLIVKKVWMPDKNGDYGPYGGKPVEIDALLNFQVEHEGEVLRFAFESAATTDIKPFRNDPNRYGLIAFINFYTGIRIYERESSSYRAAPVITLKDIDGKGYTAQFYTKDLRVNEKTQEAIIRDILLYKTPLTPIEPPFMPPIMEGEEGMYKNIEQPDPKATEYSEVKAKLSITEIGKYNNYDEKVEIKSLPYSPPVPIMMMEFPAPRERESDNYTPFASLDITVTNTYNPPVPEEEKPPVPPEENTPPKEKTKKPSVPNTGDSEAFMALFSLLAIGTTGAVIAVKRKNS